MEKEAILAAIKRAARELGRAPSRGELKRLTGVSHYRVLAEFRTLREAVRAAGLEPSRKGERISTKELVKDWKRVWRKLGRRPSRSEYVREGRYSAGALTGRFGAWSEVGFTAKDAKKDGKRIARNATTAKKSKLKSVDHKEHKVTGRVFDGMEASSSDKAIAFRWARSLAAIPGPLEGKRRVTDAVAAMIVNTLLPNQSPFTTEVTEKHGEARNGRIEGAANAGAERILSLRSSVSSVVRKDRPVMGPPFSRHPLTNAPVNEMGVVFLFALVAWELGFQVESLWGRYPDGRAKRQVAPGKWQDVALEFEYESKNFVLHGHDPKKCDVIVCWRHNWKECPEEIEVVELSRLFGSN